MANGFTHFIYNILHEQYIIMRHSIFLMNPILFLYYWCPLKIFGDFRDFYFLGQPIYWTHK